MEVVPRREWGADSDSLPSKRMTLPAVAVYLHHSVSQVSTNPFADMRIIETTGLNRFDQFSYCVDEETEILTAAGWKRHQDVAVGEQALTLNPDTGLSEWAPVLAVNRFAGPHEVVSMEGHTHSSVTTPHHRWLVERRRKDRQHHRLFATTETLSAHDRIARAAPCATLPVEPKYSDAFVELVAWFWTEGHVRRGGGIRIDQSATINASYVERIRRCLLVLFGPATTGHLHKSMTAPAWREYQPRQSGVVGFSLNMAAATPILAVAPVRVVTSGFVGALTEAQLRLFISTSIDADGSRSLTSQQVIQKSRARLDPLQFACSLAGMSSQLFQNKAGLWALTIHSKVWMHPVQASRSGAANAIRIERRAHDGMVWCPTTPNGTWLARRRGTVYFTGNSYCVHPDGTILEGCGDRVGAHTAKRNSTSFGIALIGNYSERAVKVQQLDAIRWLIAHLIDTGKLRPGTYPTAGHRDVSSTACPGDQAYRLLDMMRVPWTENETPTPKEPAMADNPDVPNITGPLT